MSANLTGASARRKRSIFVGVLGQNEVGVDKRFISGKEITDEIAEKGGEIAIKDCTPLSHNAYKLNIIRSMVKDAILRMK